MEALVECVIEDDRWESFGLEPLSLKAVRATLAALDLPESGVTVSVMGCDDARISSLNEEFRGKSKPTNVLSWPAWDLAADADGGAPDQPEIGSPEAPESLGDIAISYDTCAREAEEAGAQGHSRKLRRSGSERLMSQAWSNCAWRWRTRPGSLYRA